MGKSKLAPSGGTTIPRLELCAGVLATELAAIISEHLDVSMEHFVYHTDSKVVLGYLYNRKRRFYTYVSNRVQAILRSSKSSQWHYVATQNNPADCGTRCNLRLRNLPDMWIKGPQLHKSSLECDLDKTSLTFGLVDAKEDHEIRPEIQVKPSVTTKFEKFSTWKSLVRAFSILRRFVKSRGVNKVIPPASVDENIQTETFLLQTVQNEAFMCEISALNQKQAVSGRSSIESLSPFLNEQGILRVGGRLSQSAVDFNHKHLIIIPRGSSYIVDPTLPQESVSSRETSHGVFHSKSWILDRGIKENGFVNTT